MINRVEREKSVVTTSEILRLEDLSCYVRLPGGYPIAKIHLPYTPRPKINMPFEERAFNQDGLREEVLAVADKMQSPVKVSRQQTSHRRKKSKSLSEEEPQNQKKKQIIDEHLFE